MVESKEIVTVFEVKKISDEFEQLVPISVVLGKYDENENVFIDNNGVKYKHIEEVEYPANGFALRFRFDDMPNFDFDSFIPNQLESCKSFNYIRYSSNINRIFISAPGENFELMEDIDGSYSFEEITIPQLPLPNIIEGMVEETIKGQDDAVRKIVTSLWMTKKFPNIAKRNMLVIGPTGVGKTAIFRKLQKILDIPLTIFSVPGLSQAGYAGRSTDEILKQIFFDCDESEEMASNSIVILDEIDKLAFTGHDSGEVSTLGVQNELLKIIEGVNRSVDLGNGDYFDIDTSNIIFIGTGAFSDLYKKESSKIGFGSSNEKKDVSIDTEKLVKYGMKRELLGRFPIVVELNAMTKVILRDIILNSDESELKNILSSLDSLGVVVKNLDELIDIIVDDAINKEIGARGLVTTINNIFLEIFYQVANNPDKYNGVIIGKNIVNDNTDFKLLTKNIKKKVKKKVIN